MKNPEKPLVSVIIPTYNRAHLLPRTIESVLSQTLKDFELIIIDDGSTDNTREVVENFQKKDKRIRYIWQENSGAPARPKNTGIKNSKGKCVAFLDDDDEWLPEKLEVQINLFEQKKVTNIGMIACNSLDIYEDSNATIKYKIKKRKNYFHAILSSCFIHSCSSVLVKKEVLKDVGFFDENLKIADDWDMWIRILNKYNFSFIKKPLIKYHIHNKNTSRKLLEVGTTDDHLIIFNKHNKHYTKNPKIYSDKLRYDGTRYMLSFQKKEAQKSFLKSIKKNPLNLKSYVYLFISFFGINLYRKLNSLKSKIT